jgi:hypothetical protein
MRVFRIRYIKTDHFYFGESPSRMCALTQPTADETPEQEYSIFGKPLPPEKKMVMKLTRNRGCHPEKPAGVKSYFVGQIMGPVVFKLEQAIRERRRGVTCEGL